MIQRVIKFYNSIIMWCNNTPPRNPRLVQLQAGYSYGYACGCVFFFITSAYLPEPQSVIIDIEQYTDNIQGIINGLSNITLPNMPELRIPNLEWPFKFSANYPITEISFSFKDPISINDYGKPVNRTINSAIDWHLNHKSQHGFNGTRNINVYPDLVKWSTGLLTASVPFLLYNTLPRITNTLTVFMNRLGPNFRFERNPLPPLTAVRPRIIMDLRRDVLLAQLQDQISHILSIIARANLIRRRLRNRTPGLDDIEFRITPDGNVLSTHDGLAGSLLNSINRSVTEFRNIIGLLRTELALLDFIIWRLSEDVAHHLPQINNIRTTIRDLVRDPISLYDFQEFFATSIETFGGYVLYFMTYTI